MVDGSAGCEEEMGVREGLFEAAGAVDEDRLVGLVSAAAGAGAVDDEIGGGDFLAEFFDVGLR